MKKERTFRLIETSSGGVMNGSTHYKITLVCNPDKPTLERKIYEREFTITDSDMVTVQAPEVLQRMRMDSAMAVFDKFYTDNFIKP